MAMPYEDDGFDPNMMMMPPNPNMEMMEMMENVDDMYMSDSQLRFPSALEKALDLKSERIRERVDGEPIPEDEENEEFFEAPIPAEARSDDEDEENDLDADDQIDADAKPSGKDKKEKKRKRKKKKKKKKHTPPTEEQEVENKENEEKKENGDVKRDVEKEKDLGVEIEYVQEHVNVNDLAPMYRQFARILEAFKIPDGTGPQGLLDVSKEIKLAQELSGKTKEPELKKVPKLPDEFDEEETKQDGDKKEKLSKRKQKKMTRLSVAELKQLVTRPDVVEMHDVTARDPKLLVHLKAYRNTVPVPRHWCFKRKYLQGKRGIEKPPFDLPDFIKKTGIMEMRSSLTEKDDQKTLKAKMRERARPKMGKIDIDYQKLHDAFFKWQTKPKLTIHGDLYYEGKEYETRLREKKPGDLSDELRTALGMPVGPNANKVPPPWLIAMQRYGPPPSYPNLKIPGLNVPIPEGCSFGYHAGGWGKPPVDETGKPLYGDVFGIQSSSLKIPEIEIEVDKSLWGELESESEEESEEEEEEEEEQEEIDETGMVTPAEGLVTPSGITSIPAGIHTPENIELRKRKIESDMEGETPVLYQVLPEKKLDKVTGMMGSTHVYDVPTAIPVNAISSGGKRQDGTTVELALDPSELDLVDTEAMQARYEAQIREQNSHLQKEDLSDVVADHIRQKAKRKKPQQQQEKSTKKYKDFKF